MLSCAAVVRCGALIPGAGLGCAPAAAAVLGAVLDVEHRVVQPHLDALWGLLWAAADCTGAAGFLGRRPSPKPEALVRDKT